MLRSVAVVILVVTLAAAAAWPEIGGSVVSDSTSVDQRDTLVQIDSLPRPLAETIDDSILIVFPNTDLDTLTEAQRLLVEFETRYYLRQEEQAARVEARERLSYLDSLAEYYLASRWNLRAEIDQSFYHDAGDYFKTDPSYFVVEPQVTPLRKTVQPYGLMGDRQAFLVGGRPLDPFEHIVEPDGLVDLNDLPTALDHTVAVLPGPTGLLFGADHSVATLLTLPKRLDSTNPYSTFLVDKGAYGYSHARGRYLKNFADGRYINMSIGYRNADGLYFGSSGDDAYHYTGDFRYPLGDDWEAEAEGVLYSRHGDYPVRPESDGEKLERSRFDRFGRAGISRYNDARNARYLMIYRYLRQGSAMDGSYRTNLDQTGHGVSLVREWAGATTVFRAELTGDYLQYDSWHEKHSRLSAAASLGLARLSRPWGYALTLRQTHVEDYRFLPAAAAMLRRDGEKSHLMISLGYSERAPSLNELFLPRQVVGLYGSSGDYVDSGSLGLTSEKALQGALELGFGPPDHSVSLSVVGGKIRDGIDWLPERTGSHTAYSPANGDIDWATAAAGGRLRIVDFLRLKGGGSYHLVEYVNVDERPYTPEYQAFSGLELHLFWRQKLIDFYAYGELSYVGPYDGYVQSELGNVVMTNVKLSFRMGSFRFHWILQNSLSKVYYPRDYWQNPGYSAYYGFTWDFFD